MLALSLFKKYNMLFFLGNDENKTSFIWENIAILWFPYSFLSSVQHTAVLSSIFW